VRTILYVIYAVLSTSALVALAVYIALLYRGDSPILFATAHQRGPSAKAKVFFALATIAFLVCLYQGARAMLGWMPGGWGNVDEDGEFQHVRSVVATMFAAGGLFFVQAIDRATHDRFAVRELAERVKGLERILDASLDDRSLASTIAHFRSRVEELEATLFAGGKARPNVDWYLQPEGLLVVQYRTLITAAEQQRERLARVRAR
jgi:hypothetical protein